MRNLTYNIANSASLKDKVTSDIGDTQLKLQGIILKHTVLFSKQKYDIGSCPRNEHCIHLSDSIPVRVKLYHYSWNDRKFIKEVLGNWLKLDPVKRSESHYASPISVDDHRSTRLHHVALWSTAKN